MTLIPADRAEAFHLGAVAEELRRFLDPHDHVRHAELLEGGGSPVLESVLAKGVGTGGDDLRQGVDHVVAARLRHLHPVHVGQECRERLHALRRVDAPHDDIRLRQDLGHGDGDARGLRGAVHPSGQEMGAIALGLIVVGEPQDSLLTVLVDADGDRIRDAAVRVGRAGPDHTGLQHVLGDDHEVGVIGSLRVGLETRARGSDAQLDGDLLESVAEFVIGDAVQLERRCDLVRLDLRLAAQCSLGVADGLHEDARLDRAAFLLRVDVDAESLADVPRPCGYGPADDEHGRHGGLERACDCADDEVRGADAGGQGGVDAATGLGALPAHHVAAVSTPAAMVSPIAAGTESPQ